MPTWSLRWPARSGALLHGIDLGVSQACLLSCARRPKPGRIEHCAVAPMPAEGLQNGRIVQFELMAETLQQLVASAGGGRRMALALHEAAWQQVLELPAGLAPWAWRRWLAAQAEQLAQTSADALVWCTEPVPGSGSKLRLSVRPLEEVQDWQGLAEAAGLELVLLDERPRVLLLALRALDLGPAAGGTWVLAEAEDERCTLHQWAPGRMHVQRSWFGDMADGAGLLAPDDVDPMHAVPGADPKTPHAVGWPAGGWLTGTPEACQFWAPRLTRALGGAWPTLNPWASLSWRPGLGPPREMGSPLVALGLSLRAWWP
jgi:hypothetical protein